MSQSACLNKACDDIHCFRSQRGRGLLHKRSVRLLKSNIRAWSQSTTPSVLTVPSNRRRNLKRSLPCPPLTGMRRMYAYLLKHRLLNRDVIDTFVRAGPLHKSCEKSKDLTRRTGT